ncbi:serine/threonine-protein kinase [Adhaeretor mobilis]|uniref:non-specific serine/threonine protein kinase n=1 Tax=Adhaeretor mobilis TaxID=1930276 RepID=A0A517MQ61_9BACT|nr:serine/threonine-protein kinase [Adhaeretor mobilis]QDS97026.1 Serine/threonine-protein kinase PrkC [Adhaeretor mobilis]
MASKHGSTVVSGESSLTPRLAQKVDELCDRFESAWKEPEEVGKTGTLGLLDYLQEAPPECRNVALAELAEIELNYRRNSDGRLLTPKELADAYPLLRAEILAALSHVTTRENQASPANRETVQWQQASSSSAIPAKQHLDSQGLHIRCPHCREAVELLADTPLEEVTCVSCGSHFSLVESNEIDVAAPVLQSIGRFELLSRVGMGGFGTVWKARDTDLDRIVALKIPRRGNLSSQEIDYFFREARAAAQLHHPNIVPVYEIGRENEVVFIVSEFIRGITVASWSTTPPQPARDIAELGAQIADGLEHAHSHGVIHRDLKPSNVMVDEQGEPRLMDFGLAKRQTGEVTMTVDGQILGTAAYMSPEQAGGKSHWTDCRTDIYALGVMLFQLATGELPYRGDYQWQLFRKQTEDVPELRKFNRHIPKDFSTICLKCLERDPNRRYSTAKEVASELRRFASGEPVKASPISRADRLWRWAERKPALASAAMLTLFIALAGPTAALVMKSQNEQLKQNSIAQIETIAQAQEEKQRLGKKNQVLEGRLDELLGKVPGIEHIAPSWQKRLVQQIIKAGEDNWPTANGPEEQAKLHSALGFMYAALDKKAPAEDHLRQAQTALEELLKQRAGDPVLQSALAECLAELVNNTANKDESQAAAAAALELRRQLADTPEPNSAAIFERLVAELQEIDAQDKPGHALEQVKLMQSLTESILQSWPNDPTAFYEAACRITLRRAVLNQEIESTEED